MRVAELLKKKNAKVTVRVPVAMQKEKSLGETVSGKITGIRMYSRVVRVQVTVRGKELEFRPQDLSLA